MSPLHRSRVLLSGVTAIGVGLLISACQTTSNPSSSHQKSPEQVEAIRDALVSALKFGMRPSQVRSWLGEPERITLDLPSETWTYETRLPPTYKTIAIEMQDVP